MKLFSIKLLITVFFITALSFICFFIILTFRNLQQTQLQNNKTNASLAFLAITENIETHNDELVSKQRGYVSSSAENFGSQHQHVCNKLNADADSLLRLTVHYPDRKDEANRLSRLVSQKIENSKMAIAIFDKAGKQAVANWINDTAYINTDDSLKRVLQQFALKDQRVIHNANDYLNITAEKTNFRFLILSFIFSILLLSFLLLIYADSRKKEKTAIQLKYQASLIESLPNAIFTTSKNFSIRSWNKFAEELYNIPATEAIGKNVSDVMTVHNTDAERSATMLELNETGFYRGEYLVTKKNGDRVYILASVSTILDAANNITGYLAVHRDITERKQLEDQQKEFNIELEREVKIKSAEATSIMERITDGFLALDSSFTFTYVNKRAGEILGHTPEQMIGKNILSDFSGIESREFNEACKTAYNSQQYVFFENYYKALGIWIKNDIYPSADGLSVFFKDTTFEHNAEQALRESEEKYRHLIENMPAGVVVYNKTGSIQLYNQEAAKLLSLTQTAGASSSTVVQNCLFVTTNGKRFTSDQWPAMHVIQSGQPLTNFTAKIEKPGTVSSVWVLINAYPELDDSTQLKQVVVTFADITTQKKAEEELKVSEDNLNMAQSIAKTGSWEFNFKTNSLRWSKELYRIYGFDEDSKPDELYKRYRKSFHPEDLSRLDAILSNSITTKKGYSFQHRIITPDGSLKHILGIGELLLDDKGNVTGLKGTGQDITDLIKAEEKLQESYRQIKELVTHLQDIREQERASMAREIHDELGQQLTGLKMYIASIQKKIATPDEAIKARFSATMELIEETIKSVRKISMDLRPSMLDDLGLTAALEWQSSEFEKRSGIDTEFVNAAGNTEIPSRLKTGLFRIYQESLTNVARHADATKIVSSLRINGDNLVLTITDDGKGFAFKNTKNKKTLGLLGMRERTIEMGGLYEIKSEPGAGTTVSVTVPLYEEYPAV